MTGREVYTEALGFLMEKPDEDKAFLDNAIKLINSGITELVPVQKSRKPDYTHQKITALSEGIPIDEELCLILPLYLASHFFRDDLDQHNADVFYSRFNQAKERLKRVNFTDITDVYGGEEDAI